MPPLAGPDASIDSSRTEYVAFLSRASTKTGPLRAQYSGEGLQKAKLESGLTDTGPQIGIYDPVVSQILAGEI